MSEFGTIEKLRREHLLDGFDCGKEELNRFLKRQAWNNQQSHSAQTYVLAKDLVVRGYYSLAAGSVTHDEATERVKKGLARHPVPIILLARLAVDVSLQGKGIGPALLKDASTARRKRGRHHRRARRSRPCQGRQCQGVLRTFHLRAECERSRPSAAHHEGFASDRGSVK